MSEVSHVWRIVQEWRDLQRFPPSQSRLAAAVGVSRSAVSDWKSGKTRPTPDNIDRLAQLMEPTLGKDVQLRLAVAVICDMGYIVDTQYEDGLSFLRANLSESERADVQRAREFDRQTRLSEAADTPDLQAVAQEGEHEEPGENSP
jgi:transcriptional regulator with XRE-family HTH domain